MLLEIQARKTGQTSIAQRAMQGVTETIQAVIKRQTQETHKLSYLTSIARILNKYARKDKTWKPLADMVARHTSTTFPSNPSMYKQLAFSHLENRAPGYLDKRKKALEAKINLSGDRDFGTILILHWIAIKKGNHPEANQLRSELNTHFEKSYFPPWIKQKVEKFLRAEQFRMAMHFYDSVSRRNDPKSMSKQLKHLVNCGLVDPTEAEGLLISLSERSRPNPVWQNLGSREPVDKLTAMTVGWDSRHKKRRS